MINKLVNSIYFQHPVSIQTAISAACEDDDNELLFEAGRYISTLECLASMLVAIARESGMSDERMADAVDEFAMDNNVNKLYHERTVNEAEAMLWEELA